MLIARAARSVAAATGRFARVAEQAALPPKAEATATAAAASHALDRVGSGDLLLHRSAAGSPPPAMAAIPPAMHAPNHRVDGWIGPGIPAKGKPKVEFVAQEKDLESDEALWALYERWCKAFNQKRDPDEMVRRFKKFKDMVLLVHSTNNANLPYKLAINKFADGKLMEKCRNPDGRDAELARKAGKSTVLIRPGDRFLRQVFADFKVVNGKLFVFYPKGSKVGKGLEELNVEYEVFAGRLFVDLPEDHELALTIVAHVLNGGARIFTWEAFAVCENYSPPEGFKEEDLYYLLEKVGTPSGADDLDCRSGWLEGPNKVYIPFLACGDLSGYDSDRSYPLPSTEGDTCAVCVGTFSEPTSMRRGSLQLLCAGRLDRVVEAV
ncbi:hypothetical protein HU200_060537 [Digitaria exilis]|uniref:Cathepsin propeptide inhibitor domain-containing protein n=1 Tax=Digitaria exilis TaxID=1010633 RepID=A0A835E1K4_9POAL|nr:hypothetical protein HU200_060537 [Digitaria exilis]